MAGWFAASRHSRTSSAILQHTDRGLVLSKGRNLPRYQRGANWCTLGVQMGFDRECKARRIARLWYGEGGIRTLGPPVRGTTVFETAPFDRSGTSPRKRGQSASMICGRTSRERITSMDPSWTQLSSPGVLLKYKFTRRFLLVVDLMIMRPQRSSRRHLSLS